MSNQNYLSGCPTSAATAEVPQQEGGSNQNAQPTHPLDNETSAALAHSSSVSSRELRNLESVNRPGTLETGNVQSNTRARRPSYQKARQIYSDALNAFNDELLEFDEQNYFSIPDGGLPQTDIKSRYRKLRLREKTLITASEDLLPVLERMGLATEAKIVGEEVDNALTSTTNIKLSFTDVVSKFTKDAEDERDNASISQHSQKEHPTTPPEVWSSSPHARETPPISTSPQFLPQYESVYSLPTLTGGISSAPTITIATPRVQHSSHQPSREHNPLTFAQPVSREELTSIMTDMFQNMQEMFKTFQNQTRKEIAMLRSTDLKHQANAQIPASNLNRASRRSSRSGSPLEREPSPTLSNTPENLITTRLHQEKMLQNLVKAQALKFNGKDSLEYAPWKRALKKEMESLHLTANQELSLLEARTEDEARLVITELRPLRNELGSEIALQRIWEALDQTYYNPISQVQSLLKKLTQGPEIKADDASALLAFTLQCQ